MVRLPRPRRAARGVTLVLTGVVALAATLALPASPAGATTPVARPAAATFVKCTDPSGAVFIKAGGALLHVSSWLDYGYNGKAAGGAAEPANPAPASSGSCKGAATKTPATGTYLRAVVADSTAANGWKWSGSVYEVVGGAPITVHSWSHLGVTSGSVIPVSSAVLTSLAGPGACPSSVAGCLYSRPAGGTVFASGYSAATKKPTTFYQVDTAGHPFPQSAATSGERLVDQTSVEACERMLCSPLGEIVSSAPGFGRLHLEGFAIDFPAATPASVRLVIDQTSTYTIRADRPTDYLPAKVQGGHGFSWDLAIGAGTHEVCATVLGFAPGATSQTLGCSYPVVTGSKPGRVHRVHLKALGHGAVRVRWHAARANGNVIGTYKLTCTGMHAKQVSGTKHARILKHLGRGRRLTCRVRAISGGSSGGYGPWSKVSRPITVR